MVKLLLSTHKPWEYEKVWEGPYPLESVENINILENTIKNEVR